jgi:hypothetical protein
VLQEKQKARIMAAHQELVKQRTAVFKEVYNSYLKTVLPSQWIYHPLLDHVSMFSVFEQLLNAEGDVTIDETSFQEGVSMLPGLITTWSEERKTHLRNKMYAVLV